MTLSALISYLTQQQAEHGELLVYHRDGMTPLTADDLSVDLDPWDDPARRKRLILTNERRCS
jgi:hypothetical protein